MVLYLSFTKITPNPKPTQAPQGLTCVLLKLYLDFTKKSKSLRAGNTAQIAESLARFWKGLGNLVRIWSRKGQWEKELQILALPKSEPYIYKTVSLLCFLSLCSLHWYLDILVSHQCRGAFDTTLDNAVKGLWSYLFCRTSFIPSFSGSYIHDHKKHADQQVLVKSYMNFCINKNAVSKNLFLFIC